jgi:hypothetical protein
MEREETPEEYQVDSIVGKYYIHILSVLYQLLLFIHRARF